MQLRRSETTKDTDGPGRLWMPRRRGALTGTLLVLAGAWGALIPFVGPLFDFTIGPDDAWDMTTGRFWLSLVPGVAAVAAGLILLSSANRATATFGAWLGLAAGAWFAIGPAMSRVWNDGVSQAGAPLGGTERQVFEQLAYFEGLGVLVAALSALALGRVLVRSVGDERLAAAAVAAEPADTDDGPASDTDTDTDTDAPAREERVRNGRFAPRDEIPSERPVARE